MLYIKPSLVGAFMLGFSVEASANSVSVERQLVIGANVLVHQNAAAVNAFVHEPKKMLVWNSAVNSFDNLSYSYEVEIDVLQVSQVKYALTLQKILMDCVSSSNNYRKRYVGLAADAFPYPEVQWSNGDTSSIRMFGSAGRVLSPTENYNVVFSDKFGRNVQVTNGIITFFFPKLDDALSRSGGWCDGGATILFESVI